MQLKKTSITDTKVTVTISATEKELTPIKEHTLTHFQSRVKVPGFRPGKIPTAVLEKHVDAQALQAEFLEEAVQQLYISAMNELKLRPVDRPEASLKKFAPYTELKFEATVEVLGEVTLPDYKKISMDKPKASVTATDVNEVLESLQQRTAEKKDVNRAAKDGDQVWIDFTGVDAKTKDPIQGADGKDYPLVIGSNTFIPGFEPELIGLSAGEEKTFTITFPEDYGAKALASKDVTFTVSITKVQEVVKAKVDDEFAAKVGPFKTADELKADIKRQLAEEKQYKLDRDYESDLVQRISDESTLSVPDALINDQIERLMQNVRQDATYRGQTLAEFLEAEGKTEEEFRATALRPEAERRVKASLVMAAIAEREKVDVSLEEVEVYIKSLKDQYTDAKMQAELDNPEARKDISARILTDKTVKLLVSFANKKSSKDKQ